MPLHNFERPQGRLAEMVIDSAALAGNLLGDPARRTVAVYLPPGYDYQVLWMQRAIEEVLASQRKMLIRRGEDPYKVNDAEMAQYFARHLSEVDEWLSAHQEIAVLRVDYNQLLADPSPGVHQVNKFMGNRLNEPAMRACIDPTLYRQRR